MTKVLKVTKKQLETMKYFYQDQLKDAPNEHVYFACSEFSIMAYNSGKVVFQGPKSLPEYDMWIERFDMVDDIIKKETIFFTPSIGSDEVGKGDYFGPLVVCACYVPYEAMQLVRDLRIVDSKARTDERIITLAKKIKDHVTFSVLSLNNRKYNDLVKKGYSSVKIMSILHNQAIINLTNKVKKKVPVHVDQFCEPGVFYNYVKKEPKVYRDIDFTTKAESKHASVAVASILARYKFLYEMDQLSKTVGTEVPKGAGTKVDDLIAKLVQEKGIDYLYDIAKVSFRNTDKALNKM